MPRQAEYRRRAHVLMAAADKYLGPHRTAPAAVAVTAAAAAASAPAPAHAPVASSAGAGARAAGRGALPPLARWVAPSAGMFLWLELLVEGVTDSAALIPVRGRGGG